MKENLLRVRRVGVGPRLIVSLQHLRDSSTRQLSLSLSTLAEELTTNANAQGVVCKAAVLILAIV